MTVVELVQHAVFRLPAEPPRVEGTPFAIAVPAASAVVGAGVSADEAERRVARAVRARRVVVHVEPEG